MGDVGEVSRFTKRAEGLLASNGKVQRLSSKDIAKQPVYDADFEYAGVDDQYDHATGKFVCPPGQQSAHLPYFEPRSHGSLFYQAWYAQGLRAFGISNPFSPKEVGYFISPDTSVPKQVGRHTREAYVDPKTNLIYVTDGNGGGVTVLRYTGPMPQRPPIPGAR